MCACKQSPRKGREAQIRCREELRLWRIGAGAGGEGWLGQMVTAGHQKEGNVTSCLLFTPFPSQTAQTRHKFNRDNLRWVDYFFRGGSVDVFWCCHIGTNPETADPSS